jgi:hypothetical protein
MDNVIFEDNSIEVIGLLEETILNALEECAAELESATKRNTSVGKISGGKTKGSWRHVIDDETYTAYIGNPLETAIWLEYGTGEYALNGDGRKGGWYIPIGNGEGMISEAVANAYGFKVVNGKDGMKYAHTYGMHPQRPLFKSFNDNKEKIIKHIENELKGMK